MRRSNIETTPARRLPTRPRWPASKDWIWLTCLFVGFELLYVFYGSAGHMFAAWPIYQTYYDMLADGFRAGHLYLDYVPHRELLSAEDPWDMRHYRFWLVDGTFYHGKYYIYWGPVPALVQAGVKSVLGIHGIIGDQYITFCAFSVLTICSCVLLYKMVRRLFSTVPRVLVALGMLTLGCANPVPHLVATGGVYQGAIASAQAFLALGLLFAFDAVWRARSGRRSGGHLIAAGVAWGLALSCRFSSLPTVGLLMLGSVVAVTWCAQRVAENEQPNSSTTTPVRDHRALLQALLIRALRVGVPVLLCVGGLLVYNKLRFDEFLEFGTTSMTTSLKFHWSLRYWPANIYAYLLQTFSFDGQFPYFHQMTHFGKDGVPSWLSFPDGLLMDEPVVGVLKSAPISWLAVVPLGLSAQKLAGWRQRGLSARDRLYLAYFFGFFIIAIVGAMPVLGVFITTMRYAADFTHGLLLLGLLGAYSLYSMADAVAAKVPRRAGIALAVGAFSVLALYTIAFGLAFGFQGYAGHFQRFNPQLFDQLVERWSFVHH